jgi:ABC-type polysaccharide/polyol phosphate export permease
MISTVEVEEYIVSDDEQPIFASFVRSSLKDAWRYKWAIESFVVNNLRRRYRRSVLGFLWGLIGPLLTMTIMSAVFSLIFHADPIKYTVYVFSGLLPWTFISESCIDSSQCFIAAETYIKKLFVPRIFFPLVSVGTDTANFLFSLFGLIILGVCIGIKLKLTILLLPLVVAVNALFNLGMCLSIGVAVVYFRDLPHILRVTFPAFFYLMPIIYPLEVIPAQYRHLFEYNPFFWITRLYRDVLFNGCLPTAQEWCVSLALAVCSVSIGMYVLSTKEHDLVYRL